MCVVLLDCTATALMKLPVTDLQFTTELIENLSLTYSKNKVKTIKYHFSMLPATSYCPLYLVEVKNK